VRQRRGFLRHLICDHRRGGSSHQPPSFTLSFRGNSAL
jgi:hypothetical protein